MKRIKITLEFDCENADQQDVLEFKKEVESGLWASDLAESGKEYGIENVTAKWEEE